MLQLGSMISGGACNLVTQLWLPPPPPQLLADGCVTPLWEEGELVGGGVRR